MIKSKYYLVALVAVMAGMAAALPVAAQSTDWRDARAGALINSNGYCDQPYVVVLNNRKWLCVFTTGAGNEGTGGQHIVSCISSDQGKTWSKSVPIEQPGNESASWAMPYLTKYGRVYVFYDYNGDKIHSLGSEQGIREDMLGWYCYKYSDDEGKTWSKRYRLNVRMTPLDYHNDWKGRVQILWGIGKPVDVDQGMMFAFSKIGKYLVDSTEGWFFRCDNINTEKDPQKLKWTLLPETDQGVKNEKLGPINEEQNIFQVAGDTLYCMERTISGHPAESYSYDGGRSWTIPQIPRYLDGGLLKTPRACPRIWKCKNGKYLFWYHNHGGWDFNSRNPAWISGGIWKNGKIIWSRPEILLYEDAAKRGMSYPDLIEQDGKYWITETNKEEARCHEIPTAFINMLWSQFETSSIADKGKAREWGEDELGAGKVLNAPEMDYSSGFTLDIRLRLGNLSPGQNILTADCGKGKTVKLLTGDYGAIRIIIQRGDQTDSWDSDPGLIPAYGEHNVSVIVDNGPKIIQFVIDGIPCNGRDFRQYGWGRFTADTRDFQFSRITIGELAIGQLQPGGELYGVRLYNRPLFNTEAISNYRNTLNK